MSGEAATWATYDSKQKKFVPEPEMPGETHVFSHVNCGDFMVFRGFSRCILGIPEKA